MVKLEGEPQNNQRDQATAASQPSDTTRENPADYGRMGIFFYRLNGERLDERPFARQRFEKKTDPVEDSSRIARSVAKTARHWLQKAGNIVNFRKPQQPR